MSEKERNLCVESGCLGGCCENITIYDGEEVILSTFPDAKEVSAWEMKEVTDGKKDDGVYYLYDGRSENPGMAIARIVGPCEHRDLEGNCLRHGRCSHASENFRFGSSDCNKIRIEKGLKPVENL